MLPKILFFENHESYSVKNSVQILSNFLKYYSIIRSNDSLGKMLLQVHDELIFEAPKEEIPVLKELVPKVMDSAVDLAVPLKVESASGDTWFDAKK